MSAVTAGFIYVMLYFILFWGLSLTFTDLARMYFPSAALYVDVSTHVVATFFLACAAYVLKRNERTFYGLLGMLVFGLTLFALFVSVPHPEDWRTWSAQTAIVLSLLTALVVGVRSLEDIEAGLSEDALEWWERFFPKRQEN
ncbi:hypothetical protein A5906_07500 [Bradyrhizobium sacchari]|uniref:Uncharacterized protein n=1 Tax=Bradyrhizobium sacchari TaxID=1399419 RepID=A0A560KLB6_9BRAD|nr:hypothetical protein [Bradyrhizobium sacchari]OPY95803.1 hypothetical protein A5906_07500 [Bradyrhizobium sacchari]TWB66676.1 hypothetical protein FBZ94_101353 [Bradyrhizobium sacchari]TWB83912.1 hypothetical protein FBZ95_101352 [Bradyrhizobium sacchari]